MDLTQGNLEHTGNDLDFAVQGPGFFEVKTANGPAVHAQRKFSSLGPGTVDHRAGRSGHGRTGSDPHRRRPGDGQPGWHDFGASGAVAGKIKLVEFPPGTALESVGKTYYSAPAKSEAPAKQSTIAQGSLESSNVNPVAGAVELVAVQRYAEMMQRALSMFHSEFNRIATEDLPKVNP